LRRGVAGDADGVPADDGDRPRLDRVGSGSCRAESPSTPATIISGADENIPSSPARNGPAVLRFGNQIEGSGRYRPFRAEIIVLLFDEYRDLRKGRRRSEFYSRTRRHIEAVTEHLPIEVIRVLPRWMLRAA
jgi:hypothetical protein